MITKHPIMNKYVGLSTDEKPVRYIQNGATLFEMDTQKKYMFDKAGLEWIDITGGDSDDSEPSGETGAEGATGATGATGESV